MKIWKKINLLTLGVVLIGVLSACGNGNETTETSDLLQVVATNSIIADMVAEVGGDLIDIYSLVPIGEDPHEYEPLPEDIAKATDADVIFYNGLNLETGGIGWFANLMEIANKEAGESYFAVSEGVIPFYLNTEGMESEQDPHAWLNLKNGIIYVENIQRILSEKDPDHADIYQSNAEAYIERLLALHEEWQHAFTRIPDAQRLLVTSEGAFRYFADAYGVNTAYIWEINTEEEGTPEQMVRVIDQVNESEVASLFVESSIDPRSMEQVSRETGVLIYGTLFTDSIAESGHEGDSYYEMMKWNLETIYAGLGQEL